jgi:hypothetical protein
MRHECRRRIAGDAGYRRCNRPDLASGRVIFTQTGVNSAKFINRPCDFLHNSEEDYGL